MKEKFLNTKAKMNTVVGAVSTSVATVLTTVQCFAAEGDVTNVATSMGTALGDAKGEILAVLGVAGAAGVGIAVVKLCWKSGIGFFKSISK